MFNQKITQDYAGLEAEISSSAQVFIKLTFSMKYLNKVNYIASYLYITLVRGDYIESFLIFSGKFLGASISAGIVKVTIIQLSS